MSDNSNIFGCFVSATQPFHDASQESKDLALQQGKIFRTFIWGDKGICDSMKKLNHEDYGNDLKLVLFQFYVNPLPIEAQHLNVIENYRKREKSIGIPIIVNEDNFFSKSELGRYDFLKQSILDKLNLLTDVVKKSKLDTNIEQLKADILKVLP